MLLARPKVLISAAALFHLANFLAIDSSLPALVSPYTLGLKDQLYFQKSTTRAWTRSRHEHHLTTSARNDEEGRELLKGLGFPLRTPGVAQ